MITKVNVRRHYAKINVTNVVNVRRHYAKINVTKMKVTKNEGPYCGNKNNVVRAVRCSQ